MPDCIQSNQMKQTTRYQLRPATQTDLPQIVAMDQLIFGAYGAEESPNVIAARLAVFPAGCMVLIKDGLVKEVLVKEGLIDDAGDLLGYLTTEKWTERRRPALDEDPRATHDPRGTVLNITTLAVSPTAQGSGYGSVLVEQAVEIARRESCVEIVLETARAQGFYEKLGFELIDEYEQRGIPMAIMCLKIV